MPVFLIVIIICALIFFPFVLLMGKLFGEKGLWVAQFILIFGSLALIFSLPVMFYACVQVLGHY